MDSLLQPIVKVHTAPNITTNQNTASLLHRLYWLLLLNSVYFLYIFSIVIEHMYCLSRTFSYLSFITVTSNEKQHLPNKVWTLKHVYNRKLLRFGCSHTAYALNNLSKFTILTLLHVKTLQCVCYLAPPLSRSC